MRDQLAVGGEALERAALEQRVVGVDVVQHFGLENEEAAVDPPLPDLRLFRELGDEVTIEYQTAEA
jgi:hypothetical protein